MQEPMLPIKLIERKENIGISKNRDLALRELSTDFITHMDGNDLMSPLKIKYELLAIQTFVTDVSCRDIKRVFKTKSDILNRRYYHKKIKIQLMT